VSVTYPLSARLFVDDAATAMSATSAVRNADVIFIEIVSPRSFRAGAAKPRRPIFAC
jgi:ethanolamine utilization microcompartment shell protein EutL